MWWRGYVADPIMVLMSNNRGQTTIKKTAKRGRTKE